MDKYIKRFEELDYRVVTNTNELIAFECINHSKRKTIIINKYDIKVFVELVGTDLDVKEISLLARYMQELDNV